MIPEKTTQAYTAILRKELKPAMGCTEPIAIAYCAAYAVKVLGRTPERYEIACSGNIIKNVKAVTVPQTGGMRGIEAAVLAGAIGGNADAELEVLSGITAEDIEAIRAAVEKDIVKVSLLDTTHNLHIILSCFAGADSASVEIVDTHTGLGTVTRNGEVIRSYNTVQMQQQNDLRSLLNLKDILAYADTVDLDEVRDVLERQISYNSAISREGLQSAWGESVGKTLLSGHKRDERSHLAAMAAAGSDARMNGCAMPVVINSGSGNQGITVSVPVVEYAALHDIDREKLLRSLCVSNLCAIHQKTDIGTMSAFCGAVSAAAGAAAGIAYLEGAEYSVIAQTIVNAICTIGGMVCDGAKSSCAAKIVSAVECSLLGYELAKGQLGFRPGEGIVKPDVEETIHSVGRMARDGMFSTDKEILKIMIDQ